MKESLNYQLQLIEMFTKTVFAGIFSLHIVLPIIFSLLFYEYVNQISIIIYIALNLIVFIFRYIINKKLILVYKIGIGDIHNLLSVVALFIVLSALIHIYAFAHIFSYVSEIQMFLILSILVMFVSGSMVTMGSMYNLFVVFIVSNILPISILFAYHGGDINNTIAGALLLYGVISLRNGYKYFYTLKESIMLKNDFEERVKEATINIENKNNLLNDILEISMAMVVFYKEDGALVSINRSACLKFGCKEEAEALGKNIFTFLPEESITKVKESIKKGMTTSPYELLLQKEDFTQFYALVSGTNTIFNGEKVRLAIMLDLTEIKEKDKLMHHQAKLAQMGEMISMIAHQWRQPLSAISAASASLNLQAKLGNNNGNRIERTTDNISKYAHHLSETIDDFRNFFKPNNQMEVTNYDKILNMVLLITKQSLEAKNIDISLDLKCKDDFYSFSNEIKQVVLNIVKNAEDAIVENDSKDSYIKIFTYIQEDSDLKYILEIRDNAGGISSKNIDKILNLTFQQN